MVFSRKLYKTGKYKQKELGKLYNIGHSRIGSIVRGESWKHLNLEKSEYRAGGRGNRNGNSKLTEEQVKKILLLFNTENYSKRKLSQMFNITRPVIRLIVNNELWQHVPRDIYK